VYDQVRSVIVDVTYTHPRTEMLGFLPPDARHVLDVGCSSGAFGRQLRTYTKIKSLVGIEPNETAAEVARGTYDTVVTGRFPEACTGLPTGAAYDAIYFNDVLEHMPLPQEALRAAAELLAPQGVVIASIPNIRHISVVGPLLLKDEFKYRDSGILDSTHVRFFTARSMARMFHQEGWHIRRVQPINRVLRVGQTVTPAWIDFLSRITRHRADGFFTVQYVVVATR
jgi:2-polyprenyl-3-methyl-5-hydroxy-6-metoxy-1,4-benzoquinol methylase